MGEKLAAVKQGCREVWPFLVWVLAGLAVVGGIWALIYVPKMQVPVCPPDQTGLPPKVCFDIENEARKTLAYIMGGVLATIGITLAHRRIRALERQVQIGQEQLQVAQKGQITERFTRAIEQLGSDRMEVRLGGIYALERIANDSDKDYWTIMETLTAYVRERAPWREQSHDANRQESEDEPAVKEGPSLSLYEPKIKPAADIQGVLTVLGRRKYYFGQKEERWRLDLRNTDLRGSVLAGAHLEGAVLFGSHLEMAYLPRAHLDGAYLQRAHLKDAYLTVAHLGGAFFDKVHLEGANLWKAMGLTKEQLTEAIIDERTLLPDYLGEQPLEAKGAEGNGEE